MGNLSSVVNACRLLGKPAVVTDSQQKIERAKKIIFPGVGNFKKAVTELKKRKIFSLIKTKINEATPFLGICLGMQILFEESQEAPGVSGLGIIKGKVKKFKTKNLIVPHIGWNQIYLKKKGIFKGIKEGSFFYFVHSYYCEPKDKAVIAATTDYGINFASSINQGNLWAVQFHLEKSQDLGLKLLDNFLKL